MVVVEAGSLFPVPCSLFPDPCSLIYSYPMSKTFPKLYPILDAAYIPALGRAAYLHMLGARLSDAGVTLLEYRNKSGDDAELRADAAILRSELPAGKVKLILDDRVDLVEQIGFDGVHIDAGDMSPAEARRLLGPDAIIGTFGGTDAILPGVLSEPADYFSIGPVFPTRTKQTSKAPIGVEGVRRLRAQAPDAILVAVGGITLTSAPEVLASGADVVAVSEAIFRLTDPAGEFRKWLAELA
jgi:thiamine-phosphate pyrophosphorylase